MIPPIRPTEIGRRKSAQKPMICPPPSLRIEGLIITRQTINIASTMGMTMIAVGRVGSGILVILSD
jgi:hypothetical protein